MKITWERQNENFYWMDVQTEISVEELKRQLISLGFTEIEKAPLFKNFSLKEGKGFILRRGNTVYFYLYNQEFTLCFSSLKNQSLIIQSRGEDYCYQDEEVCFHFCDSLLQRERYVSRVEELTTSFLALEKCDLTFPIRFGFLAYSVHLLSPNMQIVIQDDDISLVLTPQKKYLLDRASFRIQNNQTHEDMGYIEYELGKNNFDYGGNIQYFIRTPFKGKKYATKALSLVKELVLSAPEVYDKDLYISLLPENVASEKVALNNGGILIYDGLVPVNSLLYLNHGIEKVRIYKIASCEKGTTKN